MAFAAASARNLRSMRKNSKHEFMSAADALTERTKSKPSDGTFFLPHQQARQVSEFSFLPSQLLIFPINFLTRTKSNTISTMIRVEHLRKIDSG
jgi:hypothetical protein